VTMFAASARHTTAGAKGFVPDRGIDIAPKKQRATLIDMSRRWIEAQEARKREKEFRLARIRARIEAEAARFRAMQNMVPPTRPMDLVAQVAVWHGIEFADIRSRSRKREIVAAKHDAVAAVYLNCQIDGRRYSLNELGKVFDVDHTTVLNSLKNRGLR
jgi:chromosomal replication initiation ATPase DnaA